MAERDPGSLLPARYGEQRRRVVCRRGAGRDAIAAEFRHMRKAASPGSIISLWRWPARG